MYFEVHLWQPPSQVKIGYCLAHPSTFVLSAQAVLFTDVLWPCFLSSSMRFYFMTIIICWLSLNVLSLHFIYSLKKCNWAPYYMPALLKVIGNQQWIQTLEVDKAEVIVLYNFWYRGELDLTLLSSLTLHALSSFPDNLIIYLIRSFQGTFHPECFLIWLKNSNKLVKILKGDSLRNCVMIDGKKMAL